MAAFIRKISFRPRRQETGSVRATVAWDFQSRFLSVISVVAAFVAKGQGQLFKDSEIEEVFLPFLGYSEVNCAVNYGQQRREIRVQNGNERWRISGGILVEKC